MKKIKQWMENISWEKMVDVFIMVTKKYPVAVAILTVFTSLGFILVHIEQITRQYWEHSSSAVYGIDSLALSYEYLSESIAMAMILLVPTFLLSLAIRRHRIHKKTSKEDLKNYIFQLLPILFFFIIFQFLDSLDGDFSKVSFITLVLTYVSAMAALVLSAKKDKDVQKENKNIYENIHIIFFNALFSAIVFLVTFIFGQIIFFSLEELFKIDVSGYVRGGYVLISLFIIMIHFLSFSVNFSEEKSLHSVYNFFITKLFFPFFVLYFIILYAYTVTVLINFRQWPEGIISYLVILFSIFGIGIFILSDKLKNQNNVLAEKIFKYFPILLVPQIAMLLYAIYLRVSEYGITISRYMVIAIGIYLIIFSGYFIFVREKRLRFIFTSLLGMVLIISFIPKISYIEYPKLSMEHDLKTALFESGIIKNQPQNRFFGDRENYPIIANFSPVSSKEVEKVLEAEKDRSTNIFAQYKKIINITEALHSDYGKGALKEVYPSLYLISDSQWNTVPSVTESLGLKQIRQSLSFSELEKVNLDSVQGRQYFSFYTDQANNHVDVKGYESLVYFSEYQIENGIQFTGNLNLKREVQEDDVIIFSPREQTIRIRMENQESDNLLFLNKLFQREEVLKYVEKRGVITRQENPEKCFVIDENMKICFQSITGEILKENVKFNSINGYLLFKNS